MDLLDDEAVVEFLMAEIDERPGYVAITNQRLIFLEASRGALRPERQHLLSQIMAVEPIPRGRRARLVIDWDGAPQMSINSSNRVELERVRELLVSR